MRRTTLPHPRVLLPLIAVLVLCIPRPSRAAEDPHARYAPPAPRGAEVITPAATARLKQGEAALWIYFTDKGETDARTFARSVHEAGGRVTYRARSRRAREMQGRFVPDYYDVPVSPRYLDAVRSTGATIRHSSRWLNAVSVEADAAAAKRIATLPFVRSVEPIAYSKRVAPVGPAVPVTPGFAPTPAPERGMAPGTPEERESWKAPALGPPAGYGGSITQLNGINAKAAQDSGYTAAGVLVAMLDTGFNKAHNATIQLKRIAEYDFVFHDGETANQGNDVAAAWEHGTGTWSVLGGYYSGNLIGPAYNASFLLAKTEDVRTETPVEEDNWLAAVEWADSIGVDVISSSLAYFAFDNPADSHTYGQLDGRTTTVTKAAALAARRGIVVANAMANSGPAVGSLQAPADADSILSTGAVDASNVIAGFSSRGPTADGRGKPEIVAQGVNTIWAVAANATQVTGVNGTSLATPLIGGAAALVREAHPEWTVQQLRYALKATADKAGAPDSTTYGWGRANVVAAIYSSPLGGPVYPKPFDLAFPVNGGTITSPPFLFRWRRTVDPNGDAVTYRIKILKAPSDSSVFDATTTDTTITFPGYLGPSTTYRWYVSASDPASHGRESRERFTFVTSSTTGVVLSPPASGVVLYPNRPNPVQSSTLIPFAIAASSANGMTLVTLRIYDAAGHLVRTLLENEPTAVPLARFEAWDGRDKKGRRVSSGIYYYRLTAAGKDLSKRMVVLR